MVMYSFYLYFLWLSLRNTCNVVEPFKDQQRSHVAVWELDRDLVHAIFTKGKGFQHSL